MAMPRGNGKTVITETAAIWALVCGHRKFVAIIGSDEVSATGILENIQTEFEHNDLLLADFPEVVYPIHRLEGINQRRLRYHGEIIQMEFTAKSMVLPTIPGSPASGSVVKVAGITGRIRGMNYKRPDLITIRPSLVIIDDPQTDESARSPSQCTQRESVLSGAVLGLSGPGQKISGIMPCTVIQPDDMADRMLDRKTHPQWQGIRTKLVYDWPTNEKLWAEYAKIRADGQRSEKGTKAATAFYRKRRKAMDAGSKIAWKERKNTDELSAIQHAWNLRLDMGDAAFWAEYQNEPLLGSDGDAAALTPLQVAGKTNGRKRGEIPETCNRLTMFVDVQQRVLYYTVCAWEEGFTGFVVEYGTFPDQKKPHFVYTDVKRTLGAAFPKAGIDGAIYAGLESLTNKFLGREWMRDDGAAIRIDQCLIDSGWKTGTIHNFCRQSPHANVMPAMGIGIGAKNKPMYDYVRKRGDRNGHHWRVPTVKGKRVLRTVHSDVNYWKSFLHAQLAVSMGDPGCLSFFGHDANAHRMMGEHMTAEYRVQTEGHGRKVDEWTLKPNRDNHLLDCMVGCAVAASMGGVALPNTEAKAQRARKRSRGERLSLAERRRRKRQNA